MSSPDSGFCGQCGTTNPLTSKFCYKCGATLPWVQASQQPQAPADNDFGIDWEKSLQKAPSQELLTPTFNYDPSVHGVAPKKKQSSVSPAAGCLMIFVGLILLGAILDHFRQLSVAPTTIAVAPIPTAKPTAKPKPTATPTRAERRRQQAEQRRREREEQQRQREERQRQAEEEKQRQEAAHRAANPLEVIEGSVTNQREEFGRYITGSVRNNTNNTYSYVQVTIGLYDLEGNQVGSTIDNVNGLEPGNIWKFKALITEDNARRYKILGVTGR